jgi:type IV pilus assembly protein PilW
VCCLFKNRERGFSLIEFLIAMTLGLIVLGAISNVFLGQGQTYNTQEQITDMVQTARAAMDMMSGEIRMAGYNPANAGFNGITQESSQLQIKADINGDGNIMNIDKSYDSNEHIVYKYYDQEPKYPCQIKRKTGNGYFQLFAENIESFTFAYLDSDGNSPTNSANIRQIRITITARTSKIDPALGDYRRYTLTSLVTPRNLGL